jgi:hypothetical protein
VFLRFAITTPDEDSRREKGVFTALYELEDAGGLADYELSWWQEQRRWFSEHLKRPPSLTEPNAILWFKDDATEHIARMRALTALLQHKDMPVVTFETARLGTSFMKMNTKLPLFPSRARRSSHLEAPRCAA